MLGRKNINGVSAPLFFRHRACCLLRVNLYPAKITETLPAGSIRAAVVKRLGGADNTKKAGLTPKTVAGVMIYQRKLPNREKDI